MRMLSPQQCQLLDQAALAQGISEESLVESAGQSVERAFLEEFEADPLLQNQLAQILVLVGPGNNGVDALVLARRLLENGFAVQIFVHEPEKASERSELWQKKQGQVEAAGGKFIPDLALRLKKGQPAFQYVFDGLFGTGLKRPLPDSVVEVLKNLQSTMKKNKAKCIAIDIPSGLNAWTGWLSPVALQAHLTVSFALAKPGLLMNQGPKFCGKIVVKTLLFPPELIRKHSGTLFAIGRNAARKLLPKRSNLSHKGTHGHLFLAAGSEAFPGAALLCAKAAVRAGAGYTHLVGSQKVFPDFTLIPEVVLESMDALEKSKSLDPTWVVGPGFGVNERTEKMIICLKEQNFEKVILDADALNVLSSGKIKKLPSQWVLTPHPGELARLMQVSTQDIQADRISWVLKAAEKFGCHVLLKGYRSLVAFEQSCYLILSGNGALAKAGSGDVLAGFLGAFRAQGLSALQSTCLAAYVHGYLADEWVRQGRDRLSLAPTDLIENVPEVFFSLRSS